MTDLIGEGLRAVAARSWAAYPLVFGAGLMTSVGPCVAPRYVAIAALAQGAPRPLFIAAPFFAGLVGAYVAIGLAGSAVAALVATSRTIYLALAASLALAGTITLLRAGRPHARCARRRIDPTAGGLVLFGAASALVVSPCCTPVLLGIAGFTVEAGRAGEGAALIGTFAAGHATPLLAAALLGSRTSTLLTRLAAAQAPSIVGGALMLGLAAYYGTLA